MPLHIDSTILNIVQSVYTTDLGLPDDWPDARRTEFIEAEAGKITWMVWSQASTLADENVEKWARQHGARPNSFVRDALRNAAQDAAYHAVLNTELFELIAEDTDDWCQ